MDPNPASDGEVYFATSLIFADARWGSTGAINYRAAAQTIWDGMFAKELPGEFDSTVNMFDPNTKQIRFVPYASAALFTDPSYHLPAFLEVWSRVDTARSAFWTAAVAASRQQFRDAAHATTGLMPDYSEFNGVPVANGGHADFRFDAWRCAMNVAMDHAWNAADATQITQSNRLLAFFASKGIASYGNQWTLAGTQLDSSHSPGLVAMNAVAVLASNQATSWAHLDQFWGTAIPEGQYRYYDGCLYMMGLLHCSGKFRAWMPTGSVPSDITPPAAITNLAVTGTPTTNTINLTWSAPGDDGATGTATTYLVRYATTAVTSESAWSAATAVTTGVPTPASAGTTQTQSVTGLTANTAYFFAVRARDEVSNLGALSNSVTASTAAVAVTPPPTPSAPTVSDTSSPSPTLSGTTVAGATITIRDGSTTVGTVVASSGGTWTWTPSPPFTAGVHVLTVVASTTAGSSVASPAVTITVASVATPPPPPPTPSAPTVSDTSSPSPTLSGTTVAGATITIRDGSTTVGTVVASSGGTWTWTPSPPFTAGVHVLTVVASTTAGSSVASPAVTITVASVATPPPPTTGGSPATDPPSTLSTAERGNKGTCGLGGSIALIGLLGLLGLRARRRMRRESLAVAAGASPEAGEISPTKLGITAKTGLAS